MRWARARREASQQIPERHGMGTFAYNMEEWIVKKRALTRKWKASALLAAVVLATLLAGCAAEEVEIRQLESFRRLAASTVDELQAVSDAIVVFTPDSRENVLSYYADGNVLSGYTKTCGVVSRVLQGDAAAGDIISITEECYTTDDGAVFWTQQGYLPMEEGRQYLLFLTRYSEDRKVFAGMYYPTELEYGKYLLADKGEADALTGGGATAEQYEIGPGGDLEKYRAWYQEVAALYPELF